MMLNYFFRTDEDFQRYLVENNMSPIDNKNEQLFDYELLDFDDLKLALYDVIIMTSRMSVRALITKNIANKNCQIIVVGAKSAALLRENNYKNIVFIGKNVEEVIEFYKKNNQKRFIYLRGNYITYDLTANFANIDEILVYKLHYHDDLSDKFTKNLIDGKIQTMKFFSAKSLDEFILLCEKKNLTIFLKNVDCYTMNGKSKEKFEQNQVFRSIGFFE